MSEKTEQSIDDAAAAVNGKVDYTHGVYKKQLIIAVNLTVYLSESGHVTNH